MNEFVKATYDRDHTLTVRVIGKSAAIRKRTVRVLKEAHRLEESVTCGRDIAERLKLPKPFVEQVLMELYGDPDNAADALHALTEEISQRDAKKSGGHE